MAPAYKLTYFDARGLAESIRFLLSYGNIEFEDVRVDFKDWAQLKTTMPFGQMPILEVDGKNVFQSAAICRYLAKQVKLNGSNDWEDLEIDSVADTISDLRVKLSGSFYEQDEERKAKLKQMHVNETMPYYFSRFDGIAEKNGGYLANGKLSWVDLYLVAILDTWATVYEVNDVLEKYPNLQKVRKNVCEVPAIKAWIEKRPKTQY